MYCTLLRNNKSVKMDKMNTGHSFFHKNEEMREYVNRYGGKEVVLFFPNIMRELKKEAEDTGLIYRGDLPALTCPAYRGGKFWLVEESHTGGCTATLHEGENFGWVSDIPEQKNDEDVFCPKCWGWKARAELSIHTRAYNHVPPHAHGRDVQVLYKCPDCGIILDAEIQWAKRTQPLHMWRDNGEDGF